MPSLPAFARSGKPLFILSFPAATPLGYNVEDLVTDPDAQAAAILETGRHFDQAAFCGLMDLSLEAEAFGAPIRFSRDDLPVVTRPIVTNHDSASALSVPDIKAGRLPVTLRALQTVRQAEPDKPLLAGCIGPFSLAGRLADPSAVLMMPVTDPDTLKILLDKSTAFLIALLRSYKKAGCDGVLMAEPLAGLMSPTMNRKFVVPWLKEIVEVVQDDTFSVVLHNCGPSAAKCWKVWKDIGAAAYHFGNAIDLGAILETDLTVPIYGNLDPVKFVSETPETIAAMTRELKEKYGRCPMWRLSSGCDIPAAASYDTIQAAFDAFHEK